MLSNSLYTKREPADTHVIFALAGTPGCNGIGDPKNRYVAAVTYVTVDT